MLSESPEQNHEVSNPQLIVRDAKAFLGHEVITILNQGDGEQSLTGWCIATLDGLFVFRIPMGLTLMPGDHLRVACGPERSILKGYDLVWKRYKHLNADWDMILLISASGDVVDHYPYGKIAVRGSRQVSTMGQEEAEMLGHNPN
jgi:hypothetical protein